MSPQHRQYFHRDNPHPRQNYVTTTPSVLLERQSTSHTELCHHSTVSTSRETIHTPDRIMSPQHRQYFYRDNPHPTQNYVTTTPSVLLERQSTPQTELCHHNTVSTSIETIHIPDRAMSPQHSQYFYRDNPHPRQNYVTTTPSVLL